MTPPSLAPGSSGLQKRSTPAAPPAWRCAAAAPMRRRWNPGDSEADPRDPTGKSWEKTGEQTMENPGNFGMSGEMMQVTETKKHEKQIAIATVELIK